MSDRYDYTNPLLCQCKALVENNSITSILYGKFRIEIKIANSTVYALFKNSKKHKELKNVLATMGREHTQAEIARMIKSIDRDGNGKISLDEFADLLD